jgi:PhzF family phenazine biosynthesis protein
MKLPIYQVDAFTSKLFRGNPAAVVLLEDWLPVEILIAVAAENNLSETAYIVPRDDVFKLRWCTPQVEIDLCGHATLATAFVLFEEGMVAENEVRFETRSGPLSVRRDGRLLTMDFPARPPAASAVTRQIENALRARPSEVHGSERDLLAVFETEEDVAALRPDMEQVAALETFTVIATAPGREVDFVSRFFAPKLGVPEDPVTGSAHCVLTPYWSQRLGKQKLRALQISQRRGELLLEDRGDRVLISGQAVLYLRGEIEVGGT